jgi:ABC-type antimicrobial peptide transport system permease subunit
MVLREAVTLTVTGLAIAMPCAYAFSRTLSSQLFGIAPTNFATWAGATLILCAAALVSSLLPASRASSIDPNIALRYE